MVETIVIRQRVRIALDFEIYHVVVAYFKENKISILMNILIFFISSYTTARLFVSTVIASAFFAFMVGLVVIPSTFWKKRIV